MKNYKEEYMVLKVNDLPCEMVGWIIEICLETINCKWEWTKDGNIKFR